MSGEWLFPPIGGFGNPSSPWSPPSGVSQIPLTGHIGKALLMEAEPKDIVDGLRFRAYGPAGTLERPSWRIRGNKVYIHPAATISRSTRPEDRPSNLYVPDVLQPTLNYGRSLFEKADPRNVSRPAEGVIDLADVTTRLEYLFNYSWDGAPITIKRGNPRDLFSAWAVVGRFSGANIIGDEDEKTIRLRDNGWRLKTPIHSEYYTGLGGLGGDEGLAGTWKPYCIGWVFNIEPVLMDGANQVFQFNIVESQAVMDLRHGGVSIDFWADYDTYEELIAASVPTGYYATCLAQSLVLCSFDIDKGIRLDVRGDATTRFDHGAPNTRAAVVRRIATYYGESVLNDFRQIDTASFNRLEETQPATVGYYWKTEVNKDDAITEVMSGILGWWHVKPDGRLAIGYARELRSLDAQGTIPFEGYAMSKISMIDFSTPRAGTHIGWRRNYGPQTREQLAGSVDEETAAILREDSRWSVTNNSAVLSIYPTAEIVKIHGGFWNQSDAEEESGRQQILMGKVRRRYRWTMEIDAFADILDKVFVITGANRLALGEEKPILCVSVDSVGFGPVTTEWWS